jgi:MoxR-like ATPase
MFVLRGDQTPFVLGPLTTAFEVANETGACILLLEEINALTPQMQKILNSTTDFRRRVEVPECQKVFQLQPGKKLWVVGTMNTAVYGGVYAMNEDLKSRLRLLVVDYPAPAEEKSIVQEALNGGSKKVDQKMMDQVILLAHETRQKALDYALSTRDVVQMVEDIGLVGLESAMRLVLGKFEGDDRTTVKERITSIFGVEVG